MWSANSGFHMLGAQCTYRITFFSSLAFPDQCSFHRPSDDQPQQLQTKLMQVQIRLADSGRSSMFNFTTNSTFSQVQQHIRKVYLVDPDDQLLITKSGLLLHPEERIEGLCSQLQQTYVHDSEGSHRLTQVPCVYVFNDRMLKQQDSLKAVSEEEIMQSINQKCTSTASLRNKSEFRSLSQTKSKEEMGRLQGLSEQIVDYSNSLLEHNEEIISLAHRFSIIKVSNEEISNMCEYQHKACTALYKSISHRRQGIQQRKKAININLEAYLKRFEENSRAIEQLRNQPAPDKLYCERTRSMCASLYQLFFDESKQSIALKRAKNCTASAAGKLESLDKDLQSISTHNKNSKIHEQRRMMLAKAKTTTAEAIEMANKMNEMQNQVQGIRELAREQCHLLMDAVSRYLRNADDADSAEYIRSVAMLYHAEEKRFGESRTILQDSIQSITSMHIQLNKQQRLNEHSLREAYRTFKKCQGAMDSMDGELKKLQKELHKQIKESDSQYTAKEATQAFAMSMKEVSKRRYFMSKIESLYNNMTQLLEEQHERRKKYISQRKRCRVEEFISQLAQHTIPTAQLDLSCDQRLPKVDISNVEDESADRSSRREADLKRDISKLKEKLQRYEKNSEVEGISRALEEIGQLTTDINNYRKMKENVNCNPETLPVETKLANVQAILSKTASICHLLCEKKLKHQLKKVSEHHLEMTQEIAKLNGVVAQLQSGNRRLKEETRELRLRLESETKEKEALESKRRTKVESADLNRTKEDQLKGAYSQIGRYKEQLMKRDEQIKDLQRSIKSFSDGKKLMDSEVTMLLEDKKHLEEEMVRNKSRMESLECNLRIMRQQQRQLQKKLHTSEQQKLKLMAELREHPKTVETNANEAHADRVERLEQQNLQIRQINEQMEIEFKCKQNSLLDRLQAQHEKVAAAQQQISELSANVKSLEERLGSHNEMITELKIMLGDKQIQLITKEQIIAKLQEEQEEEEDQQLQLAPERMELLRLRQQNSSLRSDLESLQNELNLIVMKETFEVETQTHEDYHQAEGFIDIGSVQRGKRMLFIPYSTGVYLPLAMQESQKTQYSLSNTTVMSYRSNYFLDMGSLEGKTRDFLNQCSLVMISKIEHVRQRIATSEDNPFGLKPNEPYYLVEVERPEFIVGFEEEDVSLKNYAYI